MAIIEKVAEEQHGPRLLAKEICHQVDKDHQIYEFIAGKLRLLWFYSPQEKKIIICTQAFLKKTRKTPMGEIRRAIAAKEKYQNALRHKQIIVIDGE